MDKYKARIFEIENNYYIGLNNTQINNSIEEKEILAEELEHYYCNALYYLNSDKHLKNKCEYRAMKWAYSVLIPLQRLKEKINKEIDVLKFTTTRYIYFLSNTIESDCIFII